MDEKAVDMGGPTREFWRLLMQEVADYYCVGSPGKCLFMKNTPAVQVVYT